MSECIEFEGCRTPKGYGVIRIQGKNYRAHRVAFFELHGYWPKVCRHTCDNPPCINTDHLVDGTVADNVRDMMERGRHGRAILTERQVIEIRERYAKGDVYQHTLAAEYGVSKATVCFITSRRTWRHI